MISGNKLFLSSNDEIIYDSNFRYKIDIPIYEIKNKKGCKMTYFTNSNTFCKSINFDHNLLIRLLSIELSCKGTIDKNLNCGVFSGVYEPVKINNIICSFIRNYLICKLCGNPEVTLFKNKNKLKQICKACGEKYYIKPELQQTKIYEIILKNII